MACLTLTCKQRRRSAAILPEMLKFAVPLTTTEAHKERGSAPGLPVITTDGEALPSPERFHTQAFV